MTKDKDYSKCGCEPFGEHLLNTMNCPIHRIDTTTIRNDLVATHPDINSGIVKSAQSTPKEKSISEILDTAFSSDHTNGSHADDPSDKRPCYCHNRQYAEQALLAREASIRKEYEDK